MKTCTNCNSNFDDNAQFCTVCGARLDVNIGGGANPQNNQYTAQNPQSGPYTAQNPYAAPYVDPYDHTAEFDPKDISDNKVFAMAVYLFGLVGIIVTLLAAKNSKYADFHLRQAMKFLIVSVLTSIVTLLLFWTVIVPIAAGVFYIVLAVIKIICFFNVCSGKAKEPAIIRSITFLK